jgi:hypothetical protein
MKTQVTNANAMDPLQKLSPASRARFPPSCCSLKPLKRVGTLLTFHAMNTVVAVAGVTSVAFVLASMALMPAWFLTLLFLALAMLAIDLVGKISIFLVRYIVLLSPLLELNSNHHRARFLTHI